MDYSSLEGVIFDLGSTLIEFESRSWDEMTIEGQRLAYKAITDSDHYLPAFEIFNDRLEEIKNQYRTRAAETLIEWRTVDAFEDLLREFNLENIEDQSLRCIKAFYNHVREGIVLCEGALETLERLKQKGFKTGLISNTIFPGNEHEVDLDKFGLTPYIDFRLYSSDFGYRKPYPGIYGEGLKLMGSPAERVLFVGDRYMEDVEGPRKAGMRAVLKYREGREYPEPMPDGFYVIDEISELNKLLDI
jgi:putative hydrolase of the HAD superfamily